MYVVPEGWTNIEDWPSAFDLRYPALSVNGGWDSGGISAGILIASEVGRPTGDPCSEQASGPPVWPKEWVEALSADRDLVVSEPELVRVGGLHGYEIDVSISPDYKGTCDFGGPSHSKSFLVGTGANAGLHRAYPTTPTRVIFLEPQSGGSLVVMPEDAEDYPAFLKLAMPVVDSFLFFGRLPSQ